MVNPPWRLDPLQTILKINFPSKDKDKDKDEPDEPDKDEPPPGKCPDCNIQGCALSSCATCYCPGIFCIGPGGCCLPAGCSFVGLLISECHTCGCASGAWVDNMLFTCCSGASGCQDVPQFNGGPTFYPAGTTPPFAVP